MIARCPVYAPPEAAFVFNPLPSPTLARRLFETGVSSRAIRDIVLRPEILEAVMDGSYIVMTFNGGTALAKGTDDIRDMMKVVSSFNQCG